MKDQSALSWKGNTMRGKMMFIAGLAAGYVLGTRAGRERYEQIVQAARRLRENPTLQEAAGVVQAQANKLVSESKDLLTDKLGHTRLGEKVRSRSEHRSDRDAELTAGL